MPGFSFIDPRAQGSKGTAKPNPSGARIGNLIPVTSPGPFQVAYDAVGAEQLRTITPATATAQQNQTGIGPPLVPIRRTVARMMPASFVVHRATAPHASRRDVPVKVN